MTTPDTRQDPIYQGHRLRKRLRAAREQARLTHTDVADRLEWSPSKINRIETGKVGLAITDARVLLDLYGVTEPDEVSEILALARAARQPPWWAPYRNAASAEFLRYLSYESSAVGIRNFECRTIPGLLQSEEYAKEILKDVANEEEKLTLRLERQDRIVHTDGPQLIFIIDEAVIRRIVGSEQIMKQQLEKLLLINELNNVQIKVVPFSAGLYPQSRSPYVLFEFGEEDEDLIAYLERPDGEMFLSEKSPFSGMRTSEPSDYFDAFWYVERNVAVDLTPDFLFRGLKQTEDNL